MNLTHSISDAGIIGCVIDTAAMLVFMRLPSLRKLFPAMLLYLVVRSASDIALNAMLHVHHLFAPAIMYDIYFSIYSLSFLAGSVALFYTVRQAFNYVMEPLQGLKKVGGILFRWIAIISAIVVAATALHPFGLNFRAIPLAMIELTRCISMLQLFLLVFLALSVEKLGLSYKSHVFGLGLGMGLLATTDFVVAAVVRFGTSMMSAVNLFGEIGSICAFGLWAGYFLFKEPARRELMIPATSQLLRWNEIALAIGHSSGQVVMTPAARPFFLDEVEKTVDRVLSRNSIDAS